MQKEGVLPLDVEIFAAGNLAHRYTDLFVKGKLDIKDEMLDFLPENLNFVGKHQHQDVMNSAKSKIVLTTSGAGTYGPAPQYIQHYIRQPNALIHFTGFTPEGTLGARLKNAQKGEVVSVAGLFPVKRADVQYTTEFSAHAKADEMIDFLKQFKNLKLVLVNHGEMSVQDLFAERVVREVDPKNVGILGRDYFYRINPYGLVKTLSTKF